jgi:hypothetical protein
MTRIIETTRYTVERTRVVETTDDDHPPADFDTSDESTQVRAIGVRRSTILPAASAPLRLVAGGRR